MQARRGALGTIVALLATLGLALALLVVAPTPASAWKPWGTAFSKDRVLKNGCHTYTYRYRVRIPEEGRDDWAAEVFFFKPNGRPLVSPVLIVGADPLRGKSTYRLCRPNTEYGRHKIHMKVTWTDDARQDHEGYVRPTFFRFRRP